MTLPVAAAGLAGVNVDFANPSAGMRAFLGRIVHSAWRNLGFDVAYVSEFAGDEQLVWVAGGDPASFGLEEGTRIPLRDSYCVRMLTGHLNNVVPDATQDRLARRLSARSPSKIGAYVGVPIRLASGHVFGSLCCVRREPDPTLSSRDAAFLHVLAEVIADQLEREQANLSADRQAFERIRQVLDQSAVDAAYQPIVDLQTGQVVGLEALARFPLALQRPPDLWFAEADRVGLGVELNELALRRATSDLPRLPDATFLSVNVSPEYVLAGRLTAALEGCDASRILVELTEHTQVDDYDQLSARLGHLRRRGVRVAVDDAGAGFASLRHILKLAPDVIKLDSSLTRDAGVDPLHDALVTALVEFARDIGADLIAEAIETTGPLQALRSQGVGYGQGYLFAAPAPLDEIREQYPVGAPAAP